METAKPTRVQLVLGTAGQSKDNLMFIDGPWLLLSKKHPCHGNPQPTCFGPEPASDDPLGRFRGAGYADASCFPEGDGICFTVREDVSIDQLKADVANHLGWQIVGRVVNFPHASRR